MSGQRPGLAFLVTVIVLWAAGAAHAALPSSVPRSTWVPDAAPRAVEVIGDRAYIAGDFTRVGPYTGGLPRIDRTTGQARTGWPDVAGTVWASIPDGAGGWFIGGSFSHVGGVPRASLAHITADGAVDPAFAPAVTGGVSALHRLGGTLYVGGDFTSVAGQPRTALAAVDMTTGAPTTFAPTVTGGLIPQGVHTIAARRVGPSTTLWIGGNFSTVDGQARNGIASFTDGTLNTFAPVVLGEGIRAIEPDGLTGLFLAGNFSTVNGVARSGLARVEGADGKTTTAGFTANAGTDGSFGPVVHDIARTTAGLYVAGDFATINGVARVNLAQVSTSTGAVTGWAPATGPAAPGRWLQDVAVDPATGTVFAGGWRLGVHAYDVATGQRSAWAPLGDDGIVSTIEPAGSDVIVGGIITVVGGVPRNGFAEVDLLTGRPTALDVSVSGGLVFDMAARGSKLFVAGSFSQAHGPGGTLRTGVTVLDTAHGHWDGFVLPARRQIDAAYFSHVAVAGTTVWLSDGKQVRAFRDDADGSGIATRLPVTAEVNSGVGIKAMTAAPDKVYVGGTFTKATVAIGSTLIEVARDNLAAFDANGEVDPWNPGADGPVHALALDGTTVFVGGTFTKTGGDAPRPGLAGLDATTGAPTSLAWSEAGAVHEITPIDGMLFTDRATVPALDAVDAATGALAAWKPELSPFSSGTLSRIRPAREFGVVVAGDVRVAGGPVRTAYFAVFPDPTVTLPGTDTGTPGVGDPAPGTGATDGAGGAGGSGSGTHLADAVPVLSRVTLSARRFRVARRATALSAAGIARGTTIRFRLSEAARVRFVVERALGGRRVGRSCRKPARALRRKRRCTRYVRRGVISRSGRAGANRVGFTGRLGRRALPAGRYRLVVQATDRAGQRSARRTASLTVRR